MLQLLTVGDQMGCVAVEVWNKYKNIIILLIVYGLSLINDLGINYNCLR